MENSESPSYANNASQPLLVSTVLSPNVLEQHTTIKTESNPKAKDNFRRCKKCRKTFKNYGTYLSHVRFHKNAARLKKPRGNSVNHLQQQEFYCKTCNVTCSGLSLFVEHLKEHPIENQQISVSSFLSSINNHQDEEADHHLSAALNGSYTFYNFDEIIE